MRLLTVKDVAARAGCSESNVRGLAGRGRIPGAEKVGTTWVFRESNIDKWLQKPRGPGRPRKGR